MSKANCEVLEIPCLNRGGFTLGTLVDMRQMEAIASDRSLWPQEIMDKYTKNNIDNGSNISSIIADEEFESKTNKMGIKGELKIGIACGLISVSGSAEYVKCNHDSKKIARVFYHFERKTKKEKLTEEIYLNGDNFNQQHFSDGFYTHVVTGITYGGNSTLMFENEITESEEMNEMKGKIEAAIKIIPKFSVGVGAQLEMSEEQKNFTSNLKVDQKSLLKKFPDWNPTTFEEAIDFYKKLPSYVGEIGVPLYINLTPLSRLDNKQFQILRTINHRLVDRGINFLQHLWDLQTECYYLKDHRVLQYFPRLKDKILQFERPLNDLVDEVEEKLRTILPRIKIGDESENTLVELLKTFESSTFNKYVAQEWIDDLTIHIESLDNLFISKSSQQAGIKGISNIKDLTNKLKNLRIEDVYLLIYNEDKDSHFLANNYTDDDDPDNKCISIKDLEIIFADELKLRNQKVASNQANGENGSNTEATIDFPPANVLIGLCGDGKSSLSSMLSGEISTFQVGHDRNAQTHEPKVLGHEKENGLTWFGDPKMATMTIVDTPGMDDTFGRDAELLRMTVDCLRNEVKQVNSFILAVNSQVGRFSQAKKQAIKIYRQSFGPKFWKHFIIVLTRFIPKKNLDSESDSDSDDNDSDNHKNADMIKNQINEDYRPQWISFCEEIEKEVGIKEDQETARIISEIPIFAVNASKDYLPDALEKKNISLSQMINYQEILGNADPMKTFNLEKKQLKAIKKRVKENAFTFEQLKDLYYYATTVINQNDPIHIGNYLIALHAPCLVGYTNTNQSFTNNNDIKMKAMEPFLDNIDTSPALEYEISPKDYYKHGLAFNEKTGILTGAPRGTSFEYTITAINNIGRSDPFVVKIEITDDRSYNDNTSDTTEVEGMNTDSSMVRKYLSEFENIAKNNITKINSSRDTENIFFFIDYLSFERNIHKHLPELKKQSVQNQLLLKPIMIFHWREGKFMGDISIENNTKLLKVWDANGVCVSTLAGHGGSVLSVCVMGDKIVSGSGDRTIKVWDANGVCVSTLAGHTSGVTSVCVMGDKIVSGSNDNTIKVWDANGVCVSTLAGHTSYVNSVCVMGDKIVSGSGDNTIRVWDANGVCVSTLKGHTLGVRSVCVMGDKIVSGSRDATIRVWDANGDCVSTLEGHTLGVRSVCVMGDKIVSGSDDRTIKVWE